MGERKHVLNLSVGVCCGIMLFLWNLSKSDWSNMDVHVHTSKMAGNNPTSYDTQNAVYVSEKQSGKDSFGLGSSNLTEVSAMKTILIWNQFHELSDYGEGIGSEYLARHGCPVHQCTFTTDRSQLEVVDAVVINGFQSNKPPKRSENQIYVSHLSESPLRSTSRLSLLPKWQDTFNLTITYMHDRYTDISVSHGQAVRLAEPNASTVPDVEQQAKNKTKMVLWIVSNCFADSGRMEYAKQLAQYVPVDVVGQCGNLSCPSRKSPKTCYSWLAKDYMFYLAFENSYCIDYYSEKVVNPLIWGMVPITMGRTDYARYLPPDSYIDAKDYSPKQLAQKLLHLKDNLHAYVKYLQWKRDYIMVGSGRQQGFCRLCEILHTTSYPYKSKFDMGQFWNAERLCLTKNEHLDKLGIK